ncbi:hypothetical protein [Polyangium jinanense]|uniref:Uncharacterized protein n=1 Tax=Polyangium jinanense TaxID=2829994 RepID=A0A9X3X8P4_9BACT|nr:hypothetical protein [Polyangium jinanense]MDC3959401.1 hypothetical protein [Polyangium jinanense]MDC3984835.1 hypothetical protein [Polyangium jinanense]
MEGRQAKVREREQLRRERAELSVACLGRELRVPLRNPARTLWVFAVLLMLGFALGLSAGITRGGKTGLGLAGFGVVLFACGIYAAVLARRFGARQDLAIVLGLRTLTVPALPLVRGGTVEIAYEDLEGVTLLPSGNRLVHVLRTSDGLVPLLLDRLPRSRTETKLPLRIHVRAALARKRPRLTATRLAAVEAQLLHEGPSVGALVATTNGEPEVIAVVRDEAHLGAWLLSGELPADYEMICAQDVLDPLGDALRDAIGAMVDVAGSPVKAQRTSATDGER